LLIFSQVILSLQLGFAIIPLIHFVSDKKTMGNFVINTRTKIAAWVVAALLIYLNVNMLLSKALPIFADNAWMPKMAIIMALLIFIPLLLYILLYPRFRKNKPIASIQMHPEISNISELNIPIFNKIAVALDFTEHDHKLLSFAIGQGKPNTHFLLIHVVESASAGMLGSQSDDYETRKDKQQMDTYVQQLQERGFIAEGFLGYKNRASEIARITKAVNADMIVMGAHGHSGLKDFIYGETVNTVRHEVKIPVLIVNL